jgi:hypothetical protein
VLTVLSTAEARAFSDAVARAGKGSSGTQVFEHALMEEVQQNRGQPAAAAVLNAAQGLKWGRRTLQHKVGVRFHWRFLKQGRQSSRECGRQRKVGSATVTKSIRSFLLKHSSETSRFCRTKPKHQKVSAKAWAAHRATGRPTPRNKRYHERYVNDTQTDQFRPQEAQSPIARWPPMFSRG